jgi:PmbA protein
MGGFPYSRHSMSVAPIAQKGQDMQRDHWYSSARRASDLALPEALGEYAARRALSRLGARRLPTGRYPVLFEAPLALGLVGAITHALSGGSLYRKSSFLTDSLGKVVLSPHLSLLEDPEVPDGMGTSPFDDEGVATAARQVISNGVVQGYFLSSYTARKLGMSTTGNAGGSHNLRLVSARTRPQHDLNALVRHMHRGLLVTELMGHGINYVTGDYSRGAFGYWVDNGEIQYPVQEITIAGNLRDMLMGIQMLGSDELVRGNKCCGSMLLDAMQIAGQ